MPGQKSDVIRVIPAGAPTSIGENHFINCYPESVDNSLTQVKRAFCQKRKGLVNTHVSITASGEARGVHHWDSVGYTYAVYGDTVYYYSGSGSATSLVTLASSTGPVGFTEIRYDNNKLFFCDGVRGYLIDSATPTTVETVRSDSVGVVVVDAGGTGYTPDGTYNATFTGGGGTGATGTYVVSSGIVVSVTVTDAGTGYTSAPTVGFPTGGIGQPSAGSSATATAFLSEFPNPHIPQPCFLDGFIFLAESDSTTIKNCGVNAYTSWNSSSGQEYSLRMNQFPGPITGLVKLQNYIIALKTDAIEYAYNAANTTGSPLSRTTQAASSVGCAQTGTVIQIEDAVLFVGQGAGGGFGVWKVENFKEEKVSTEYIDYVLNNKYGLYSHTPKSSTYLSAIVIRMDGHRFYVLNEVGTTANQRAIVYDVDEKFWSFWDSSSDSNTKRYIGIRGCTKSGVSLVQIPVVSGTGKILYHSNTSGQGDYNDDGTVFYSYYNTPVIDMDNRYRKRFNRIEVIGNKYSYSNPVTIDYSDSNIEDLDKLTNSSWVVNMQTGLQGYLTNLGSSRSRIWQIGHSTDAPLRYENIELFYSQGEH